MRTKHWTCKGIVLLTLAFIATLPCAASAEIVNNANQANPEFLRDGSTAYWSPTGNGSHWIRLQIRGMEVVSIKKYKVLAMEEVQEASHSQFEQSTTHMNNYQIEGSQRTSSHSSKGPDREERVHCNDSTVFSAIGGSVYHTSTHCHNGKQVQKDNRTSFNSEKQAKEAGLMKCRRCLFIETMEENQS